MFHMIYILYIVLSIILYALITCIIFFAQFSIYIIKYFHFIYYLYYIFNTSHFIHIYQSEWHYSDLISENRFFCIPFFKYVWLQFIFKFNFILYLYISQYKNLRKCHSSHTSLHIHLCNAPRLWQTAIDIFSSQMPNISPSNCEQNQYRKVEIFTLLVPETITQAVSQTNRLDRQLLDGVQYRI